MHFESEAIAKLLQYYIPVALGHTYCTYLRDFPLFYKSKDNFGSV